MMRFTVGQKLMTNDGKLHGEVFEISDEGRSGVLVITRIAERKPGAVD